jgi:hypothetical protein
MDTITTIEWPRRGIPFADFAKMAEKEKRGGKQTNQAFSMTYSNHTSAYLISLAADLDLPAQTGAFPADCDPDTRELLAELDRRGLRCEAE